MVSNVFQAVATALLLGGVSIAWSVSERVSRLEVQLAEQTKTYERDRGRHDAEAEQMRKDVSVVREMLSEMNARLSVIVPHPPRIAP